MTATIFIVERHDYQHYSDDSVGRKHFHSAHTALKAANRKAKVLLYRILRFENENDCGDIESETIKKDGTFCGMVNLRQNYHEESIDYTIVRVFESVLQDETCSVFSDEEEREDFEEETGEVWSDNEGSDEEQEQEEKEGVELSLKTSSKHARTTSMTTPGGGLSNKKARTAGGTQSQPIVLGSSP